MASLMEELIATLREEQAAYQELLPVVEKMKKDRKSNVKYQLALNPANIV